MHRTALLISLAFAPTLAQAVEPTEDEIFSLAAQHHLDYDVPIYDATFVGTHNSFSTEADGYPSSTANQAATVTEQLEAGYRWLDIDVHKASSQVVLCHKGSVGICLGTETKLKSFLNKVAAFLDDNPDEVVFISVQDELAGESARGDATRKVVNSDLADRVFTPDDFQAHLSSTGASLPYYSNENCTVFPMTLTKQDIRDQGRNVVLLRWLADDADSRCATNASSEIFDVMFDLPLRDVATVKEGAFGFASGDIHIKDIKRGDLSQFSVAQDDRCTLCVYSQKSITASEYETLLNRGAHMVTLDFAIEQAKHDSVTWSWSTGEPSGSGDCVIQTADGDWKDVSCDVARKVACQSDLSGLWAVTEGRYTYAEAEAGCTAELGSQYFFSTPVHAKSNARLNDVNPGNWVMINMVRDPDAGNGTVPSYAFAPGDFLEGGQSRSAFYLSDVFGNQLRNESGGLSATWGNAQVQSCSFASEGIWRQLWLVQGYESGMDEYFVRTVDDTVWDFQDGVAYASRQNLSLDDAGEFLTFRGSAPDAWPVGATGPQAVFVEDGSSNELEFTAPSSEYIDLTAGSDGAPFFPYWKD